MAAKHNGLANGSQTPLKASIFQTPSYPTNCLYFLQSRTNRAAAPANDALRLKIIVVGAGLGGLATAIALAQHGHSVTVYEQTPQLGEVGAGIQIPSNSTRLLVDLGLEPYLQDYVTEPRGIFFRRWENGQVIGHTRLIPDFRQTYHAAYYVIHRADFHTALYRRAIDLGVTVRLDSRVVDYDANRPSVTFQDGTSVSADLIVAADGVKSIARRIVLEGNDQPPRRTGFAAYRSTVEVDRLKRDPEIRSLLQEPALNIWIGDQRHVMTYTIGAGKTFNLVLSHPDDTDPSGWDQSRALEDMKAEFRGWDPTLTKIIAMVDKTLKWPLLSGTPLDRWVSGKLVILGDAAHAMVPYMSQGAAMAVEDGVALAHSLSKVRVREHIPTALSIFERVRQKRTTQMQEASLLNGQLWHFADGPLQQVRDRAMMPEVEGRLFSHSPNQWSDPTTQVWCYGYDARGEIDRAWMGQKRKSSL